MKPTMYIQTFGCQMNERESEKYCGVLLAMGYTESATEAQADLVLYNTCCVRESAESKIFGRLGRLKSYKKKHPDKVIIFCGCMPQQASVIEEINRKHKHIDIIFGTFNKHRFPHLLREFLTHRKRIIEIWQDHQEDSTELDEYITRDMPHKTGVTIMHGCNNFCSYCIVPYVRGREKSRSVEDILGEITALANDGVKEVMLLGQNVNSYAHDFPSLILKIAEVPGIERIRFMTSHPKDLSQALIDVMRDCDKACKHIHLPIQSGSSRILQAMNRGYTKEDFLSLINRLREAIPGISVTTDIIVGFPGETDEDFEHTLDAVQQAGFAGAYTFLYSHRKGTPAAELPHEVPEDVAKARFNRLLAVVNETQLAHNERYIGRTVEVLADAESTGRTDDYTLVHFDKAVAPGDMVRVHITECKTFYTKGFTCQ